MSLSIAIRTDASGQIGAGHVMRCLTLANELTGRGAEITFICRSIQDHLAQMVRSGGHGLVILPETETGRFSDAAPHARWLGVSWETDATQTVDVLNSAGGADWLIVDHYALERHWQCEVRQVAKKIMVIDDLADRSHDCDMLLDQTLGRSEDAYSQLVPDHCSLLLGAQYALLRPTFRDLRPSALRRRAKAGPVQRILISFGGYDPQGLTAISLKVIGQIAPADIVVDVALGGGDANSPGLTGIAGAMRNEVIFHDYSSDMAQLMCEADLALGAAGTSSWERCCLGLPTLMVVLASNQNMVASALGDAKAAIILGDFKTGGAFSRKLGRTLKRLLASPELIYEMSGMAFDITQGLGPALAATHLLSETVPEPK